MLFQYFCLTYKWGLPFPTSPQWWTSSRTFLSSVAHKYSNIMLGTEKFGSKMDCCNLRSAQIIASWSTSDGTVDTSGATRPGIVSFYLVQCVKISGEFNQHVFSVVWWHKFDEDQENFGKPIQVWKLDDYDPCGPALFMPVQRIAQRYASCSVTMNGCKQLIVSPVPRLFY